MTDTTLSGEHFLQEEEPSSAGKGQRGLMIAWSPAEPWRAGEVALIPRRAACVLGRGEASPGEEPRLLFRPLRPGPPRPAGPPGGKGLSRRQLIVTDDQGRLRVQNIGKAPLWHRGRRVDAAVVEPGERLLVEHQLLLLCVERGADLNARGAPPPFEFGSPDPFGLVGEGELAWRLRDRVEFCARREGHVLIHGPSGAGKELAARAVHGLSTRRARPFVGRNAATIPPGILDAELFGNAKNFPNPGMRERQGLVGAADGGTLFLDEIGEIPQELQAHLLRLLDDGEYHRLGDDRAQRVNLRVVAATNRDPADLKHDLLARFSLRVPVPGLADRREDIPLQARTLLRRRLAADLDLARRFADERGEPRLDPLLIDALLDHDFPANTRELDQLLLLSMMSPKNYLALTDELRAQLRQRAEAHPPPTPDEIRACLARVGGNVSAAWRDLGLSSRDALRRLIRKHGIDVERP